jgi:plasmid stability protein
MRALTKAAIRRRKIHVDLPEEIHRKLRVKAALEDVSMQAYVARVVEKAVKNVPLPEGSNNRLGKRGSLSDGR